MSQNEVDWGRIPATGFAADANTVIGLDGHVFDVDICSRLRKFRAKTIPTGPGFQQYCKYCWSREERLDCQLDYLQLAGGKFMY